jgi:hypothetical protein
MEPSPGMQAESLGKVLPRILFPYVQQWADRQGMTLLSRLLVDDQFRGLIEKYGDEIVMQMARAAVRPPVNGRSNGSRQAAYAEAFGVESDTNANDLRDLHDRVLAMEAQQDAQQALFQTLRDKSRPLALALGCCPLCFVGVEGCPGCQGRSKVGLHPPDFALLDAQIVQPLAERGVSVVVTDSSAGHRSKESIATTKRSKTWPRK